MTVVVATHNRPSALAVALSSLCAQTMEDWLAWVIGDCCDCRTGAVVDALKDSRIRYINLPERCGDQSGPNSIGASLCRSRFLAFLNHDDILLKDHLQVALTVLNRTGAEFYLGRSYHAIGFRNSGESVEPEIVLSGRRKRNLWQCYASPGLFEPASSWVMEADAYRRVGDWRDGFALYRWPIDDWLLRAARSRVRAVEGDIATVVRVHNLPVPSGFSYDAAPTLLQAVGTQLAVRDADAGRTWLAERSRRDAINGLRSDPRKWVVRFLRLTGAPMFRIFGWDLEAVWWRLRGRKPGHWKRGALQIRTLETVNGAVNVEALKKFAQQLADLNESS